MQAMNPEDHFEDLRTVHFSLVVTCLALLVVGTTSQDRTLKAAQDQLRALQSSFGSHRMANTETLLRTVLRSIASKTRPYPIDRSPHFLSGIESGEATLPS